MVGYGHGKVHKAVIKDGRKIAACVANKKALQSELNTCEEMLKLVGTVITCKRCQK